MENTTKMRILDEALVCFAENGYKGTNLRDLAARLGLTKSALYRHYDSKEAIWDAVIDRMERYYSERFGSPEKLPPVPESCEELLNVTRQLLDFTLHDEKVILTRRLLLTEQFRDERARKLATRHFLTGTRDMYAGLFKAMMERGILKRDDPEMLAFAYTSPITALVHLCDREPEREAEVREELERFLRHFAASYCAEPSSPVIKTERLRLRPSSDAEMRRLIESETDADLKAAYGEMLSLCEKFPEQRQWYAAWVISLKTGERVGDLCFKGLSAEGCVEIGYGLLPEFFGNGYATEAVTAVTQWAAAQPGVKRIEAETDEENFASQRVLERAGFVSTGTRGEEGPRFVWLT